MRKGRAGLVLALGGLALSLGACAYFKVLPDNAKAFEAGLACQMDRSDVDAWAASNGLSALNCGLSPETGATHQCDTGTGRAEYRLYFDEGYRLTAAKPGYVYDLTHLHYEEPLNLCAKPQG